MGRLVGILLALCTWLVTVNAAVAADPDWPTDAEWEALTMSGDGYADAFTKSGTLPTGGDQGSFTQGYNNIIGTATDPAGYFYNDPNHVFFRMRVSETGDIGSANIVWQWPLDNDLDSGTKDLDDDGLLDVDVEWVVEVRQNKADQTEIALVTTEGTTWDDLIFSDDPENKWVGSNSPVSTYARWVEANTDLDNTTGDPNTNDDYFIDAAVPANEFVSRVGNYTDFVVYMGTSQSHTAINKDQPDYPYGSDPVQAPEPAGALLLLLAASGVLLRRPARSTAAESSG
jgi:hypothetical protein